MTNPLEQIRELEPYLRNYKQCDEDGVMCSVSRQAIETLLAILDASQGYECVPVEVVKDAERWKFCEAHGFPVREQSHGYMLGSFMRHETPTAAVDYCMLAASKETNREPS